MNLKQLFTLTLVLTSVALGYQARADEAWDVNYTGFGATSNITGGIDISVTRAGGPFSALAYCVDRYSNVGVPSSTSLQATLDPANTTFAATQSGVDWLQKSNAATLFGQAAWIYDTYGASAGADNSTQAFATQLAIWNVLGELGAGSGDPAVDPHAYGSAISTLYDQIVTASNGQSADAYYMARTPSGGYAGQALITNVPGFHTNVSSTPEGSSLLLIAGGFLPLAIVPLKRRLRRKA